ncbi:MAG: hypothetical protein L0216_05480 [Planctomycetales bacterium]|nr:hypothetical protein [Planctomycetales bacterium]
MGTRCWTLLLAAPLASGCGIAYYAAIGAIAFQPSPSKTTPGTETLGPAPAGRLYSDDFEGGLAGFTLGGAPVPVTAGGGNPGSAFDPRGGSGANGEAVTKLVYRTSYGLAISADAQVPTLGSVNSDLWFGLRTTASVDGVPQIAAGVFLSGASSARQYYLNNAVVFSEGLPDTSWHRYLVNIRSDCRVEFYVDGALVHLTAGTLAGGGLQRPVTLGGRSAGAAVRLDNLLVAGTGPTATITFSDGFAGGSLAPWTSAVTGSPSNGGGANPSIDAIFSGNPAPSFNPGGGATGSGEALSNQLFALNGGLEIRADIRVPSTTVNARAWCGLDDGTSTTSDGVPNMAAGVLVDANGPNTIQYHFGGSIITPVGSEALTTTWHSYRIVIRSDRFVEYYRDGLLVVSSPAPLSPTLGSRSLTIGGVSLGAAARVDNVAVVVPGFPISVSTLQVNPTGPAAPARRWHSAIFDPLTEGMVIHGGFIAATSTTYNDTRCLVLAGGGANWVTLNPTGTAPAARQGHTAVYDSFRKWMWVFGGQDSGVPQVFNDTFALDLSVATTTPPWVSVTVSGTPPSARFGHAAAYDVSNDRMIVFGGTNGTTRNNQVWELKFSGIPPASVTATWTQLTPFGTPPSAREGSSALYDGPSQRMIVACGFDGTNANSEFWALSLPATGTPTWGQLAPVGATIAPIATGPGVRFEAAVAGWTTERRAFLFGGLDSVSATYYPPPAATSEVWMLDLGCGGAAANGHFVGDPNGANPQPPARRGHTMVWHPQRRRLVVFGGEDGTTPDLADVWELRVP